jgi:hypothetical protein
MNCLPYSVVGDWRAKASCSRAQVRSSLFSSYNCCWKGPLKANISVNGSIFTMIKGVAVQIDKVATQHPVLGSTIDH